MNISLRRIAQGDREACIALSVAKEQQKLIASNRKSLAQADLNPRCIPLGIYANEALVGFAMYEHRGNDVFSVHRLMIHAAHQREGIGLRAMRLIMDEIWAAGGKTIYLSFRPENAAGNICTKNWHLNFAKRSLMGSLFIVTCPWVNTTAIHLTEN